MDKVRRLLRRSPSYEAVEGGSTVSDEEQRETPSAKRFSWLVYSIFLLIGIAMLWAWNMFLAAGPYFQRRFHGNKPLLANFQAAEISVANVIGLVSMIVLAKLQAHANYPRRIITSLTISMINFTLLALSTKTALGVSAGVYFAFLMTVVFVSSLATAFIQNGSFAFVLGFGRSEYMQAIMFGQAIAGVLPPLVQMISVLSAREKPPIAGQESSTSAFAYFLTATGVASITLLAFFYLATHHHPRSTTDPSAALDPSEASDPDFASAPEHKSVPMRYLFQRLFYPATAVFFTFGITMVFPVFTQKIVSTASNSSPLLAKPAFIPLAFLVWNLGDLAGRLIPLAPRLSLAHRPKLLFILSLARLVFIPLYLLCNIEGSGDAALPTDPALRSDLTTNMRRSSLAGTVSGDVFYLLVVQLPFGLSNGFLGSCCMMGVGAHVAEAERPAAGAFMGLMLVAGLAVGSLCSFLIAA